MKLKKFLKDRDIFGHQVTLNFNRNGDTVNTSLGGIFSIIYKLFIWAFLFKKLTIMRNYSDDTIITSEQTVDVKSIGLSQYKEMKTLMYFQFLDSQYWIPQPYDEQLFSQYLSLITMFEIKDKPGEVDRKFDSVRVCTRKDFEDVDAGDEFDKRNYGNPMKNNLICFNDSLDLALMNDNNEAKQRSFALVIQPCKSYYWDPKTCKTDDEINKFVTQYRFQSSIIESKFDPGEHEKRPVRQPIRKNHVTAKDSWFHLYDPLQAEDYEYFDLDTKNTMEIKRSVNKEALYVNLYSIVFKMSPQQVNTERSVYGFLDALGDFGGLSEVLYSILSFVITPLAHHNFVIKALSKLYLASTSDGFLFGDKKSRNHKYKQRKEKVASRGLSMKQKQKLKNHRHIKLSTWQSIELFLNQNLWVVCQDIDSRIKTLYEKGVQKLDREMDIVKLVRGLRKLKIISKQETTSNQKLLTRHDAQNLIYVDSSDQESRTSSSEDEQNKSITQVIRPGISTPQIEEIEPEHEYGDNIEFNLNSLNHPISIGTRDINKNPRNQEQNFIELKEKHRTDANIIKKS